MNPRKSMHEETMKQVQMILEERGRKTLEMTRKTVLEEEIESKEIREAIKYFITEYWHDIARPALLSLVCEAVGGNPDITTPVAIPMTLISGAIDIHDDIIDQSKIKRCRPTVLGKFGEETALLVGDALLFKGFTLLNKTFEKGIPAEKTAIITDIIRKTFFELGDAEALELQFRGRTDITTEEYLHVVRKKAADVEAHTRISAMLGGGSKADIDALSKYGRLLGMLIILRDDLVDTIDFEEIVHKIKREHLPLPIVYALQYSDINSTLSSIFLKKKLTKRDAKMIFSIVEKAGGLHYVDKIMHNLAKNAYYYLQKLPHDSDNLKLLIKSTLIPLQEEV